MIQNHKRTRRPKSDYRSNSLHEMEFTEEFRKALRERRESLGISITEAARCAGIHHNTYASMETGERCAPLSTFLRACVVLQMEFIIRERNHHTKQKEYTMATTKKETTKATKKVTAKASKKPVKVNGKAVKKSASKEVL